MVGWLVFLLRGACGSAREIGFSQSCVGIGLNGGLFSLDGEMYGLLCSVFIKKLGNTYVWLLSSN